MAARSVKQINSDEVATIYHTLYADKVRYDELPASVDYAALDGAVHLGVSRGAKWPQSALGVISDGKIGRGTISAAAKADAIKTIKSMCAKRMSYLRRLGIFSTFGKGWTSRVARVEAESVSMAMEARGISAKSLPIALAAEADAASTKSKNATAGVAGSGTAAATSSVSTDWSNLAGIESIILIGAAAAFVVLAVYPIHRSHVNKERAAAYAAVAAGVSG